MADTPPMRKFMFDRSFDAAGAAQRPIERKPVTLKPEQVDALKKESYDLGFAAGQKAGADEHAQQLAALMAHIDKKLAENLRNIEAAQQEQQDQTREIVLAIARKILPDLTSRYGVQEIQALIAEVMTDMIHEPRLVVRVHETQFDAVNTKINEISIQQAYTGKVVLLADPTIAAGDCRIEWADGGVERNVQSTWQNIEQRIAPNTIDNQKNG